MDGDGATFVSIDEHRGHDHSCRHARGHDHVC